jgi:hypothetical protein
MPQPFHISLVAFEVNSKNRLLLFKNRTLFLKNGIFVPFTGNPTLPNPLILNEMTGHFTSVSRAFEVNSKNWLLLCFKEMFKFLHQPSFYP